MRIAVASSGLGHVSRGIETWALETARSLHHAAQDVTLFGGAGNGPGVTYDTVSCMRRFDPAVQQWAARMRRVGGWRVGLGSAYEIEQATFAHGLWRRVRKDFDLVHVQDHGVAWRMERLWRAGLSRPRVILAHGTQEPPEALRGFSTLQHLSPAEQSAWECHRPGGQKSFAVPNSVDCEAFSPGDRSAARRRWQLPEDALIVLSVAALKRTHKRIDALIDEFAAFAGGSGRRALLLCAGAREEETPEVTAYGRAKLGDRVRFLEDVGRADMPDLFRAADIFALASLHEMMPIALLEALASALPVAVNDTAILRWMAGPDGVVPGAGEAGSLACRLSALSDPVTRRRLGAENRARALERFSSPSVAAQTVAMYREVLNR